MAQKITENATEKMQYLYIELEDSNINDEDILE